MRHVKRAARADLHRFKAFIGMNELETGAWRGVIEDGEPVEPHDEAYDEQRRVRPRPRPRSTGREGGGRRKRLRAEASIRPPTTSANPATGLVLRSEDNSRCLRESEEEES